MNKIFKACDIRGVAGKELTVPLARQIGMAVAAKLDDSSKVVVGGDVRLSTPELKSGLIEGLIESGCQVYDIGIVATPVFYYALKKLSSAGGVMVTASHNPAPYNGFKLTLGQETVTEADIAEIGRLAAKFKDKSINGENSLKNLTVLSIMDDYLNYTQTQAPRGSLKVVIDAGNGAVSTIAPALYRRLGYEVIELYCEPDGRFPNRPPNPALAENLTGLCQAVINNKADLGIAFDGDGDRVAFVDETGCPVDNDKIIVLIARHLLSQEPGTVVYDAKCSMVVPEQIKSSGGRAVMARAGHTFSKAAFHREKALFAGEISGHFFFRELGYDDAMFAGLKVAEIIAGEKKSLSAQAGAIGQYLLTPDIRVKYAKDDKEEVLEEAASRLNKLNLQPNRIDGIRLEFPDGWGMIRASVTEPLFTLRFEAKSPGRLREITALLLDALPREVKEKIVAELPEECI